MYRPAPRLRQHALGDPTGGTDALSTAAGFWGMSPMTLALVGAGALLVFGFVIRPRVEQAHGYVRRKTRAAATHPVGAWKVLLLMSAAGLGGYAVSKITSKQQA